MTTGVQELEVFHNPQFETAVATLLPDVRGTSQLDIVCPASEQQPWRQREKLDNTLSNDPLQRF
jgi:hypothetical protein